MDKRMDPAGIRVRLLLSAATISGGSTQFHFRQVDARLAFVRGVVADPEEPVVKHKPGVTGVAAGRQLEALGEFAGAGINPRQRRAHGAIVEPHGGEEPAVRQAQQVRPADFRAEILPGPICVGRLSEPELSGAGTAVPAQEADGAVVGLKEIDVSFGCPSSNSRGTSGRKSRPSLLV